MNFEELLQATIKYNQTRDIKVNVSNYLDRSSFNREFKTIHLNGGRQSGKTDTMCRLARKDDLIVVHNEDTRRNIIRAYPNLLAQIITTSSLERHQMLRGRLDNKFNYVWIDEPHHVGYDAIYVAWRFEASQFILLGE
jgi:hypothetical protein